MAAPPAALVRIVASVPAAMAGPMMGIAPAKTPKPTSPPMPAPAIADLKADPDALRPAELKLLRNTRPFNVWGLPAISVPCGFTKSGLPIGLQIAGPHWREDLVLRLAYAYESAVNFSAK